MNFHWIWFSVYLGSFWVRQGKSSEKVTTKSFNFLSIFFSLFPSTIRNSSIIRLLQPNHWLDYHHARRLVSIRLPHPPRGLQRLPRSALSPTHFAFPEEIRKARVRASHSTRIYCYTHTHIHNTRLLFGTKICLNFRPKRESVISKDSQWISSVFIAEEREKEIAEDGEI